MKPRYKLVNGHPERVGLLQGKKVVLIAVEPSKTRTSRYCHQCVFDAGGCADLDESKKVFGKDCADAINLVYKEVK